MNRPLRALAGTVLWLTLLNRASADQEPARPLKPARIALVRSGGTDALRNVLDLTQVKLTAVRGIELLERGATERILAEHKLSLAGLVDAATAVQAGKLLAVDLFGVVEAGPDAKDALGLVVYDAATGVKLWDKALAGSGLEQNTDAVAAGVRAAAAKWRAGSAKLKTVSFLPVRNADLPADKNAFCQALAAILERRLVNAASCAVLERKRLAFVNQEKELVQKPAYQGLLASLILIELQVSRAPQGDGLRVLAFLTDHQGKQIAKIAVDSKDANLAELIDPLLDQINKKLAISAASVSGGTVQEGKRFAREALILLSHDHYSQALEAAESAFALAPAQPEHAALLVRCLTTEALFLANPTGMRSIYGGSVRLKVDPSKLKTSLRLARRGFDIRTDSLANLKPRTSATLGTDFALNILTIDSQRFYRNHLQFYDPAAFDAEASALRAELLAAMDRLVITEVNAYADVARGNQAGFSNYTLNLLQRFTALHNQAPDGRQFGEAIDHLVRDWLKIAAQQDFSKITPSYLTWFLGELERFALHAEPMLWKHGPEGQEKFLDLFKTMARHPHPLIALAGRHGVLEIQLQNKQLSPGEALKEFHQIAKSVESLLQEPPPWFNTQYRVASYKYVLDILGSARPKRAERVRCAELLALCRLMIDRSEIVFEVVRQALVGNSFPKELQKERFELIKRTQALTDSPSCCFLQKGTEPWTKQELLLAWEDVVRAEPSLSPPTSGPWDRVQTVIDLSKGGDSRIQTIRVVGNQVYAAIGGFDQDRNALLQVIRIAVPDGAPQYLAKASVQLAPSPLGGRPSEGSWINFITGLAVGADVVYVATQTDGIYAFPSGGAAARRIGIKQGLPSDHITALALFDAKVYAGLQNGYFIAFDPESERCTVLASSQRKEKLTPFDDGSAFSIPYLVADPERERVLFILYQGMPSSANRTDGLWEFNVRTHAFTQRLKLWRHANLHEGSAVHAGRIILSAGTTYLVSFDLAHNQAALLSDAYPIGPDLKTPDLEKRRQPFAAFPYLCIDGWLWTAHPFGRKAVDGGSKREIFPALATARQWTSNPFVPRWLEQIGNGKLILIGDPAALWLVHLRRDK